MISSPYVSTEQRSLACYGMAAMQKVVQLPRGIIVANADCGWLRTQHQDRGLRFAWRGQKERRLKHPIQGEPVERCI
jgi:hypothetical protein